MGTNGDAGSSTQGVANGASWEIACNLKPIRDLISRLEHLDMLKMDSVGIFLYDFILKTRAFSITFDQVPGDPDVANSIYST